MFLGAPAASSSEPRKSFSIADIAQADPQLCVAMLGGCGPEGLLYAENADSGWGKLSSGWRWQIVRIRGCFDSGAACQTIPAQFQNMCDSDLLIYQATYIIERPNWAPGSLWQGQGNWFNSLNPHIDFTLLVRNRCYIAAEPTPIALLPVVFTCQCPVGFVLGCGICVEATFTNKRPLLCNDPLSTDPCCPGEVPTEVIIALHTIQLPCRYEACSMDRARHALSKAGLLPSRVQVQV